MPSDLDDLMNFDPLELTRDSPELDKIIAHYRSRRATFEATGKAPKVEKEKGPKINLLDRLNLTKPKEAVKRRV